MLIITPPMWFSFKYWRARPTTRNLMILYLHDLFQEIVFTTVNKNSLFIYFMLIIIVESPDNLFFLILSLLNHSIFFNPAIKKVLSKSGWLGVRIMCPSAWYFQSVIGYTSVVYVLPGNNSVLYNEVKYSWTIWHFVPLKPLVFSWQ